MTKEELDFIGGMNMCDEITNDVYKKIVCHFEEQEPCEDCISRAKTCDYIAEFINHEYSTQYDCEMVDAMIEVIHHLPSVKQEPKTDYKSFAEWVASEIFSDNWEYNKDSFPEIACRKLNKLGIVTSKGDAWKIKG